MLPFVFSLMSPIIAEAYKNNTDKVFYLTVFICYLENFMAMSLTNLSDSLIIEPFVFCLQLQILSYYFEIMLVFVKRC